MGVVVRVVLVAVEGQALEPRAEVVLGLERGPLL